MWIVRIHTPGKRPPSGSTWFAGCKADWERVRLKGEAVVATGAHIPDAYPKLEQVRDLVRGLSSTLWVGDDRVETLASSGAAPKPAPALSDLELVQQRLYHLQGAAAFNGWDPSDVNGTGLGGEPGEAGGRSPTTGLTLVELTLTRPPIDWPELKAAGRPPWESPDWHLPGPGWVHPSWPDRLKPVEAPPKAKEPDPEPTAPPEPPTVKTSTPTDDDQPPEVESDDDAYPAEHAAAAAEIVRDLVKKKGGQVPHPNAVKFLLRKAGLPEKITTKQIAAMIATT